MKYDITSDACRICLRKSSTCRSIFKPLGVGDMAPNVKLNLITGINVLEKEDIPGLPQFICKQCEISVNMAYNLRKRARRSDQILSVYCNKMNQDNIIVELANGRKFKLSKELTLKVIRRNESSEFPSSNTLSTSAENLAEINSDEEAVNHDDDDDDEEDDDNDEDDDYIHEDDKNAAVEQDNEDQCDDFTIEVEDIKFENRDASSNHKDAQDDEIICIPEDGQSNAKPQPIYNGEEIAKQIKASNQYEVLSWNQEDGSNAVPTFKLRLKEPAEKIIKKDFICDICGNTYGQKHRLTEHMRRHNPEKVYACEICGKRFAVSEGLRRHVLTHGALKPYKCNHCTRCFYTPSARKAHEKVHSGHKPFVCNICTKAFAYTGSLRKHMLIHENKKLYRCEYCDKAFRLQHHMKQHEETQIHKDAVAESVKTKQ
ncbi:zinc finger protein 37-like [Eupeodes corollae]|uniref:zinc finger protein 37-like n=1 Tax=Eupeodes corollae TaxID=290404 RepID=UPI0024926112|nr:zinc finger protein 37-like [Eupeodes corollae]